MLLVHWVQRPSETSPVLVPAPDQVPVRLNRIEHHVGNRADRDFVTDREVLELGQDAIRTPNPPWASEVLQDVIAVESGAEVSHLHQPGPNIFRLALDGDRPGSEELRVGIELIAWHGPLLFFICCAPTKLVRTCPPQVGHQHQPDQGNDSDGIGSAGISYGLLHWKKENIS